MTRQWSSWRRLRLLCLVLCLIAAESRAQTSKSAALAQEVAQAFSNAKLGAFAAPVPDRPDEFVAALYIEGSQLLVVSARYSVPMVLMEHLQKKEYQEVYLELNGAALPDTKVFIEDQGADGLQPDRKNALFDSYLGSSKRVDFDGDSRRQKMSEEEYTKTFVAADENYARILTVLLAGLKKGS